MEAVSAKTTGSSPALLVLNSSKEILGSKQSARVVEVHPLVILSVLDHHTRRNEGVDRVIGTLLGRRDGDKVEVTNSFAVPHAERGDEVAIGKDFNRQMLGLHLRSNRRESVVGWYATAFPGTNVADGNEGTEEDRNSSSAESNKFIADTSSLIHEFYAGECNEYDPIHLVIDTSLVTDGILMKAYKSSPVQVKGEPLANMFHEVQLCMKTNESERICLHNMTSSMEKNSVVAPTSVSSDDAKSLQISMERLLEMLESASQYVDTVIQGYGNNISSALSNEIDHHDKLGRQIADTLSQIPHIPKEFFDKMFHDTLQDLLMISYLSNVTRTQLTIAEKLNAILGI